MDKTLIQNYIYLLFRSFVEIHVFSSQKICQYSVSLLYSILLLYKCFLQSAYSKRAMDDTTLLQYLLYSHQFISSLPYKSLCTLFDYQLLFTYLNEYYTHQEIWAVPKYKLQANQCLRCIFHIHSNVY